MNLELSKSAYTQFLGEFRAADKSGASGTFTEVVYSGERGEAKYYFRAPNFYLVAYNVGGGRVQMTDVRYPKDGMAHISYNLKDLKTALESGGGGGTTMTDNLCIVATFISEAARSKVVTKKMMGVFRVDGTVKIKDLEFIFKEYGKTAEHCNFWRDNSYLPNWRPLTETDYELFFTRANMADHFARLKQL